MNIFQMLRNFDLSAIVKDPELRKDLAYVQKKYEQAKRHFVTPQQDSQIPIVTLKNSLKADVSDCEDSEDEPEWKPGYMSSPYRVPYTTMG